MVKPVLDRVGRLGLFNLCPESFEGVGQFGMFGGPDYALRHFLGEQQHSCESRNKSFMMRIVFCEDGTDVWYESTNRLNVESKQKLSYGVNTRYESESRGIRKNVLPGPRFRNSNSFRDRETPYPSAAFPQGWLSLHHPLEYSIFVSDCSMVLVVLLYGLPS